MTSARSSRRALAIALAIAALTSTMTTAAQSRGPHAATVPRSLVTALERLHADTSRQRVRLGREATRLVRAAGRARRAASRGRPCRASAALSRLVERSKRLKAAPASALAARGRRLQRRLFLVPAARRTSCGLPKPRVEVRQGVEPARADLPAMGGARRRLARLEDARGHGADFVADELLVSAASARRMRVFLSRWDGRVLRTIDTGGGRDRAVQLVRIDPSSARTPGLVRDLRALDPLSRGRHRVSSAAGLRLLAAAADEAAGGLRIGINWVNEPDQFLDHMATEGPSGPGMAPGDPGFLNYGPNPFAWWYMRRATPGLGAAEGWRVLEIAARGATLKRVKIAVIDEGFRTNPDLSSGSTGVTNVGGVLGCSGGSACPWHGTSVAAAAAAVADNQRGVAGAAGPIGDVVMITHDGTAAGDIGAIYQAIQAGARVINMSFGADAPAIAGDWSFGAFEDATQAADAKGVLVVASAGNAGLDVDAEDCFAACWEERWHAPCENAGVLCVGGVRPPIDAAHPSSNYGYESCGSPFCQVEIFGPWEVYAPSSASGAGTARVGGTSLSAPYVAGVAALVWSANPALSDDQVYGILLGTAHPTIWAKVPRVVSAYDAVKAALGGQDLAPLVRITAPANGSTFGYGGLNVVSLSAEAGDAEDFTCCSVHWSSNADGALGSGASHEELFSNPGMRVIRAVVRDSAGHEDADSVVVNVVNSPPAVAIAKPLAGATLARGTKYRFEGTSNDAQTLGPLPCPALKWTLLDIDVRPAKVEATHSGCQPLATLDKLGDKRLTVTATDADGATASAELEFSVVQPPPNTPPLVWIEEPANGSTFASTDTVTLKGDATDPDGGPVALSWTVTPLNKPPIAIGTGSQLQWRPFADSGVRCRPATLRLDATDDDGTSSDEVSIDVFDSGCIT
jgi:subtilisin family serine protease